MIARIIPALRMPRDVSYDYRIPATCPIPSVGALVRIRVHGRTATGLVVETFETSLVPAARLKDIDGVFADGAPLLTQEAINLLPRLALHYRVPLPLLLRNLLPNLPARKASASTIVGVSAKQAGAEGVFSVVQMRSLFDAAAVRALFEPMIARGPLLILAPTKQHALWLTETCADFEPVSYDGSAAVSAGASAWAALLDGQHRLLIATRSGVLAPLPPEGSLVLFAEEDASYQQFDAEPKYDSRVIARARCRAEQRPLLALAEAPSVAMVAYADTRHFIAPEEAPMLVSLADERRAGFRGVFSDTAMSEMQEALEEKRDVLVCVNRKGTALALRCGACFQTISCPTCGQPLRVFGRMLSCTRCGTETSVPDHCPACASPQLRGRGLTIETATQTLRTLFPEASLSAPATPETLRQAKASSILLGTEMLIHSLRAGVEERSLGAIIVPSVEQLFGIGYRDSEEGYATLRALQAIAERHRCALVLQTYDPTHPVLAALTTDPTGWYDQLMEERRTFRYPPTHLWIRLTVPENETEEAVREQLCTRIPPFATVDEVEKNVYSLKFENASELIPEAFATLPASWHWQVNPRT